MVRDLPTVDPDVRAVVDRAEVQQPPPVGHGRGERPPVPDDGVEPGVADAARGGLEREGHHDRAVEEPRVADVPRLVHAGDVVVEREAPGPAEVDPAGRVSCGRGWCTSVGTVGAGP